MIEFVVWFVVCALVYASGFFFGRRSVVLVLPSVSVPFVQTVADTFEQPTTVYISPALYERPELVDEFRVETKQGTAYKGTSGADARRVVERLRGSGEAGEFFQNDVRRDWWPR